ncbi:serine/arginine repetitive matrix protein 1 [Sporothrix schenckii 1099-18]|uniref:Serine/arginine repetitive matrix protein 1 n=1 Tax=Sporothrix schenckii 1099-18 TaxID=1397361 RepID=A0A0F2M9M3_SPOSC|nr:serine/arginine repetitive matrix protein 1 [Sporothrix schenckii 1099-18]KJR84861.1 serine/arginine repetitive matrix protein 1 [Sporothrix schenckii 1099-18]
MATGVDAKLLKSTKFPPIFNQKVDTQKVNLQPDIKSLQIQLTGFLESQTPEFCKELWTLLLSAQSSPQGIPRELLEAKKMELIQEKIEAEKAADEARRKRSEVGRFDRDRPPRGGDRGDSWRGGAGGGRRGNDSRRGRRSFRGNDGSVGGGGQGGRGGDRDQTPLGRGRGNFRSDRGDGFRSAQHDLYVPNDRRVRGNDRRGDYHRRQSTSRSSSYSRSRSTSRSTSERFGSSYSRSRSRSESRSRSRSPPRHRAQDTEASASGDKRLRSPPRTQRDGRKNGGLSRGRSPLASRSPIAKRRRYSLSRSRSRERGRRSARSVSSSGSSRYSRIDNSRTPPTRRRRGDRDRSYSSSRSRSRIRSKTPLSDEDNTGRTVGHGNGRNRGGVKRGGPLGQRRRRDSSSGSSRSRSRSRTPSRSQNKSADVPNKEDRPATKAALPPAAAVDATTSKTNVTSTSSVNPPAKDSQTKTAERLANEKREKELRERIKQMRSSKSRS